MKEIIVVHGPPYSGKSTQSEKLKKYFTGIHHVSSGNLLRAIRTGATESRFGNIVRDHMSAERVNDNVVNSIMFEFISKCPENSIVLVDGYPRFKDAVGLFINKINDSGHRLLGCINVDISLDTSLARFSQRGIRRGERLSVINIDVVKGRYHEHETYTLEAIRELGINTTIINIDGNLPVETVWGSFYKAFDQLVCRSSSNERSTIRN